MSQIKILFTGCEKVAGIKKADGKPYGPFYQIHYLVPVKEVNHDKRQVSGIGHVPQNASVTSEVFQEFSAQKPLTHISIELGPDPENFNRTVISGVSA